MKIRLVTSLREFDALAPIWREVTMQGGQTSPFVSHDWFACCWRTAGPNRHRELWVLEDTAGPVALIPLVRRKVRVRGLPVCVVELLDSLATPFVDFPAVGPLDNVVGTFLEVLRGRRNWDVLSLRKLPVHSKTVKALESALPGQFSWRVAGREQSPYLTISGSWEEFFRHAPQEFRKACRSIEEGLRRGGAVAVEEHREVDPEGRIFADLMEVSQQNWQGPDGFAMTATQGMQRFFRELTQRASANEWLHLWILRLDGRAVATEYQVGANGCLHALRADFDPALAHMSPGAYLNLRIAQSFFERPGIQEYDMGPGANPFKLLSATGAHETLSLEVYSPTSYGRLLHGIETRLVPFACRLRARVRARCA